MSGRSVSHLQSQVNANTYDSLNISIEMFLVIQDILTGKIKRNRYVNEEKSVSNTQILINETFINFISPS